MIRGGEDQALLHPTLATGANGVEGLLGFWRNSTDEVKNLMNKELDVIYECRYCRNLFRSIINFVTHKRNYCRGRIESISAKLAASEFANNAIASSSNSNDERSKTDQQQCQPSKRSKAILKRTNIINALNKRIEHYALALPNSNNVMNLHTLPRISRPVPTTTFEDGEQVIETMPRAIATKESLPPERVPLVIPQDYSYRYREMNLRYRKTDSARQDVAREVGSDEIAIMDRLCKYVTSLIELSQMVCLHSDCKEKRPFSSIFTLAYHITVKHNRRWLMDKRIPCFLCDSAFKQYDEVITHLKDAHYEFHKEHCAARAKIDEEKTEPKRGRKPKTSNKTANGRYRSLSPQSDDFVETDESSRDEESDSEHVDEREASEDVATRKNDVKIKEEPDVESEEETETNSPPQSLSSVNIDAEAAASPEWAVDPPHLTPEVENDIRGEEDERGIETSVRKAMDYILSTVCADGEEDAMTKECCDHKSSMELETEYKHTRDKMPSLGREVSSIDGCEVRGDRNCFLIKWTGSRKRSWVFEENLKRDPKAKSLMKKMLRSKRHTKPLITRAIATRGSEKKRASSNSPSLVNVVAGTSSKNVPQIRMIPFPPVSSSEATSSTTTVATKLSIKLHKPKRKSDQDSARLKHSDHENKRNDDESDDKRSSTEKKSCKRRRRKDDELRNDDELREEESPKNESRKNDSRKDARESRKEDHTRKHRGESRKQECELGVSREEDVNKEETYRNEPNSKREDDESHHSEDSKPLKSPEDTRDDISVNSDDADEIPKVRPSRHRRKPNWIDDANYVTAFNRKRARANVFASSSNEIEMNCCDESIDQQPSVNATQQPSVNATQQPSSSSFVCSQTLDSHTVSHQNSYANASAHQPIIPEHPALLSTAQSNDATSSCAISPAKLSATSHQTQYALDSEHLSASLQNTTSDHSPAVLNKKRLHRSLSPQTPRSNSPASVGPHSVASDPGVVLPASFVRPIPTVKSASSDYHDSRTANAPKSVKKEKDMNDSRFLYTPRARKLKFGEDDPRSEYDEEHDENTASGSTSSTHSRRKQNLSKIHENDNVTIVRLANGRPPPRPDDLSEIPVYLTEMQRDLFFSFIRPESTSTDGVQKCMQCGKIVANMMEGRRHAVGHLRIMRLRCSLCDCGSFFCSDMRMHLQYRHCPKLQFAPRGYILPGDAVPCMTQRQADELTKLVDPQKPGRVMYTSGKIVSSASPVPYYPDPEIEKRVLGTLRPAACDMATPPEQMPSVGDSVQTSKDESAKPTDS